MSLPSRGNSLKPVAEAAAVFVVVVCVVRGRWSVGRSGQARPRGLSTTDELINQKAAAAAPIEPRSTMRSDSELISESLFSIIVTLWEHESPSIMLQVLAKKFLRV